MNEQNLSLIPHHCVLQMQGIYDSLKSAEIKAADFILSYPEVVSGLTIVEFARQAGCSEATIVRLSKRLGYDGFPELKKDFALYQKSETQFEYENITNEDSPFSVLKKVFDSSSTALQDTFNVLDNGEYEKAVEAVSNASSIMFCGVGDAAAVAMEANQRYLRIGKHCFFSQDSDINLILASQLSQGDVIVAISHSGRSKMVIDAVKTAKEKGAIAIAVTNFPVSLLAKKSDIILQTAVFSKSMSGEVMAKRITALCIIESLYINSLIKDESLSLTQLKQSNEVVKENKI